MSQKMLVKCETKSNRVKGLSFHPKLSWILVSLHNGTIQLWDYRFGTLIEKFESEHEGGPVRGVCFHPSQPLFVSGGDDYKLRVWNYKLKRCLFTLTGHLDYIRTVQFHSEAPWILSASDDQTVRLWNWQSRGCIAVLTGHNHYVMSASFHPKDDLLVSASLDQTVRVWDIAGLKEKTAATRSGENGSPDMFGTYDAVVKYVLEGHDRGVNWASFHPNLPLIISGADDRLIKLWRYSESKAWEVDTLKGHFSNVSSVIFHPKQDLIVSNSEDRTIRVWDTTKRTQIHTFRRENDRFWVICGHPTSNLMAVGHDGGMVVFKLDRERPLAMVEHNSQRLFYVKGNTDRSLVVEPLDGGPGSAGLNQNQNQNQLICSLRRPHNAMQSGFRSLEVNQYGPSEGSACLIFYSTDQSSYDLCVGNQAPMTGPATAVAFVQRNRFAVLQPHSGHVGLYNFSNELTKKFDSPVGVPIENLFAGGNNRLVLKLKKEHPGEERVCLFDITTRKVINEVMVGGGLRYVIWSGNFQYCALICKHNLVLVDKNFEVLHALHENIRIKSGSWDNQHNIFIYATLSHVKYCLLNGDYGIIHSLQQTIYIQAIAREHLYYLDRDLVVHKQRLNCTEYLFKLALHEKNFLNVKMWIKNGRLCGNVVIGYLKKKGYPEVALHFVEDPNTRFNLALEYGHLSEALKAAQQLDDISIWSRLGVEASRQGSSEILEMAFQKTKNLDSLSFHYLLTGNLGKLKRMLTIAEKRNDSMRRYNNSLMLGNVEERVKVLAESGQLPLAYLTAKTHNLKEMVTLLEEGMMSGGGSTTITTTPAETMKTNIENYMKKKSPRLLLPPVPVRLPDQVNWPHLHDSEKIFESSRMDNVPDHIPIQQDTGGNNINQNSEFQDAETGQIDIKLDAAALNEFGGDLDLDLGPDPPVPSVVGSINAQTSSSQNQQPRQEDKRPGDSAQILHLKQRKLCVDFVIAGQIDEALDFLRRRIGLTNAKPLLSIFQKQYLGSQVAVPGLPSTVSKLHMLTDLNKGVTAVNQNHQPPRILCTVEAMQNLKKEGDKLVQVGQFDAALKMYEKLLHSLVLAVGADADEEKELQQLVTIGMSYCLVLNLQLKKKEITDPARELELVNLMTIIPIDASQQFLFLRQGMISNFKAENFIDAATLAQKILQAGSGPSGGLVEKTMQQARTVLRQAEEKGTNKHTLPFDLNRIDVSSAKVCAGSLSYISEGEQYDRCSYCEALHKRVYVKKTCSVCKIGEVGRQVMGMQFRKQF